MSKYTGMIAMPPKPIGYLEHHATHTNIAVYHHINIFQRWMIRICFGLKYTAL